MYVNFACQRDVGAGNIFRGENWNKDARVELNRRGRRQSHSVNSGPVLAITTRNPAVAGIADRAELEILGAKII